MRTLVAGACASYFLFEYVRFVPMKQLFSSIPAKSTFDRRDETRALTYARTVVPRTHRAAPTEPIRGRARVAPFVACVALLSAVFCRVRLPGATVAMLANEGRQVAVTLPDDACDIEDPLAKALCLSSIDGMEVGSTQWVLNGVKAVKPRVKAVRKKLPRVNIAGLLGRKAAEDSNLHDDDACDTAEDTMQRALCMGSYDPFSMVSVGWVQQGIKAVRSKLPKAKSGGLRGVQSTDLHDEVDACDTSEGTFSRALCLDDYDPFSSGGASWILNRWESKDEDWVGNTISQSPDSKSAGGWFRNLWHTKTRSSSSAQVKD